MSRVVPSPIRLLALVLALLCAVGGGVAIAQAAPDAGPLALSEVATGVHVHSGLMADWLPGNDGDVANLGLIVGNRCAAVIDTGGTPQLGLRWRAAIERTTSLPICYVINTHAHPDHMLGDAAFIGPGTQFVAGARFGAALRAREPYYLNALRRDFGITVTHLGIVYPTLAVERSLELDLGGRVIVLQAWPTAHTDNDVTVYDRSSRTLFASDLLFVQHLPVVDGNLRGWLAVMKELAKIDVAVVVPGHGAASRDWPAALAPQQAYLEALLRETRAAIKSGTTLAQAVESVGTAAAAPWQLTERFHRRNVTAAFAELEWED